MKPGDTSNSLLSPQPATAGGTARVCVVGSVNEDTVITVAALPTAGQTVAARTMTLLPGGKGANQAVAAARAGASVVFIGAVGDDQAGRRSLKALRDEGIDCSAVLVQDRAPTGTAIVTVADNGDNQITILAAANDEMTADDVTRAMERLELGPTDVCLVCFEVTDEAVVAAANYARSHQMTLVVNPAPARPLAEELRGARPILVPNASEAEAITGLSDGEAAAERLHELSGTAVVVTRGGDGVRVVDSAARYSLPALSVEVVDTTGAGDAFCGVLTAMLALGHDLRTAADNAVVAAGLSVTAAGARDGSPRAGRITEALKSRT